MSDLGDESHYICFCYNDIVKRLRKKFIPDYYVKYPHVSKMHSMVKYYNINVLTNLVIFTQKVENTFDIIL
jgi:hypothetical protein